MKTLLGQRIREQRRKKGWTMDKLAEKADQSVNYVGDLERGVKTPSLDTFIRIVEALDVPADVLIRDSAAPASYVADDELNRKLSRLTPGQKKAATDILNAYIPWHISETRLKFLNWKNCWLERKRNTFATRKGQSSTRWAKTLSDKSHRMLTLSSG